jgi:hypothetical protein
MLAYKTLHGAARWRAAAFVKTRTPPERRAPARAGSREPSFGGCTKGYCYEGSASQTHGARQKFLLFNQLRFLRRFMRLLTRSGFRGGNTACNNLAPVLDDFPIPATVLAVGHNAEFNVFHILLGPSARNDYQGELGHFLPRRTQSTRRRGAPARGPEEKYRPPYPSSRRTACRPGLDHATILPFEAKPLITLTLTLRSKRTDGPVGFALCRGCGVRSETDSQARVEEGADGPTPHADAGCPRSLAHPDAG